MNKERLTSNQLFAMMVLFELGTALVVPIGLESKRTIWLSILMAVPGGVLFYLIYVYLSRQFPGKILSGITVNILGKWIAWPVNLLYIAQFLYNGSRNLREAASLLTAASYDRTPIIFTSAFMIIAVIYILNQGTTVLGRTAEIYFVIMILMGVSCNFVVIVSGLPDMSNLFPLHLRDWKTAVISAYPNVWVFPFLETVVFTTIIPHLNKSGRAGKTGMIAMILSGILLTITHAIEISVLGEDIYSRATFPLFTTIALVNLADFIQRLDAFVFLTLIIGVFFKLTIYCYAVSAIATDLFKIQDSRKAVLPVGIVASVPVCHERRELSGASH
ncbi:GerAB/ArcD/ProY family transporter [Paenibacillus stellifer]|uniref:GerAB/ArcD/ProY family transporter n=1 Tax=Paenibacillus stellifer TaxID=169760 RepID=UPI000A9B386D|nr:GerAB/ArcD/ProY family transporter [Paenibacillus stellifer]